MPIISQKQLNRLTRKKQKNKTRKIKLSRKTRYVLKILDELMRKPLTPEEEAENQRIFENFDQYRFRLE